MFGAAALASEPFDPVRDGRRHDWLAFADALSVARAALYLCALGQSPESGAMPADGCRSDLRSEPDVTQSHAPDEDQRRKRGREGCEYSRIARAKPGSKPG